MAGNERSEIDIWSGLRGILVVVVTSGLLACAAWLVALGFGLIYSPAP